MSRECVICHGARYGFTVATDEKGERVLVHASPCASILSERRQKAAHVTPSGKPVKKAGISMWSAEWEPSLYGPKHKSPCGCPRHKESDMPREKDPDLTWDRVVADDPDLEYQ